MRTHAKCGEQAWIVEPRKREDGEQHDFDKVHEFYTCKNPDLLDESFDEIRREAADLQRHVDKRPSSLRFRMCTECEKCRRIILLRQAGKVDWSPEVVLAPLASNDFMPWMPGASVEAGEYEIEAAEMELGDHESYGDEGYASFLQLRALARSSPRSGSQPRRVAMRRCSSADTPVVTT